MTFPSHEAVSRLRLIMDITDTDRLDWLERNLRHLTHERATCSVDMGGVCVRGQLENEARGSGGGPSVFRVAHRSIRDAVDAAMRWSRDRPSTGIHESSLPSGA